MTVARAAKTNSVRNSASKILREDLVMSIFPFARKIVGSEPLSKDWISHDVWEQVVDGANHITPPGNMSIIWGTFAKVLDRGMIILDRGLEVR